MIVNPKNKGTTERRASISERQKHFMLAACIRNKSIFETVGRRLSYGNFIQTGDISLALVWSCILEWVQTFDALPNRSELITQLESRLEQEPNLLTDSEIESLNDFLSLAYAIPDEDLRAEVAAEYAKQFLEDLLQRNISQKLQGDVLMELPKILERAADEAADISSMKTGAVELPFPTDWRNIKPLNKTSTGISFLDYFMNGGDAPGEVYGFCGPYSSCKTTLGIQIAVAKARQKQIDHFSQNKTGIPPIAYVFVWEDGKDQIMHRTLSHAAYVDRSLIEDNAWDLLSTSYNLKPEELSRYANELARGVKVPGECERIDAAVRELNINYRIIDFSGSVKEYRNAATELADGVASVIHSDQAHNGNPGVAVVIVDYAKAAADAHISRKGLDPATSMRHIIGNFPLRLKNKVAVPFNCPVWVMHQLGTKAQSMSPGFEPGMTDMAEARNFFENCAFGFTVGTKTKGNLCVLSNPKQRRAEVKRSKVLYIDGKYSRVVDTNGVYTIDKKSNRIVETSLMSGVVEPEVTNHYEAEAKGVSDWFDSGMYDDGIGV